LRAAADAERIRRLARELGLPAVEPGGLRLAVESLLDK